MTASNDAAAIAVLQNQQRTTEQAVEQLGRQVAEGFAGLGTKIDAFATFGVDIVRLQEREKQHTEAVARAFGAITGLEGVIARCRADHEEASRTVRIEVDADLAVYEKRIADLETAAAKQSGWFTGALWVGGGLYTLVLLVGAWFASDIYETVRTNSMRITTMEAKAK